MRKCGNRFLSFLSLVIGMCFIQFNPSMQLKCVDKRKDISHDYLFSVRDRNPSSISSQSC